MKSANQKYSVLMSVYKKEKPEFLRQSMESIFNQSVSTDDFVLICDGELTKELNEVIEEMKQKFGKRLNVVRKSENQGLGSSLNLGVTKCKNDLIGRMDSDDVSRNDRFEKELKVMEKNPDLSVVGSVVAEFEESPEKLKTLRKVPETHTEIKKFAKIRSPMNHPSVMFRKKDVLAVGNYRSVRYCQDYYLWEKMLAKGFRFYNIQEPLVYMREDKNSFRRRSGKEYFKIQKNLFSEMRKDGLLSAPQYYGVITLRYCSAISPNWLRKKMFSKFMREKI